MPLSKSHDSSGTVSEENEVGQEAVEVTPEITEPQESGFLADWRGRAEAAVDAAKVGAIGLGIASQIATSGAGVPVDHQFQPNIQSPTAIVSTETGHKTSFDETQPAQEVITGATGNESSQSPVDKIADERLRQDVDDLAESLDMEHEAMRQQGEDAIEMNSPSQEVVEAGPEPAE